MKRTCLLILGLCAAAAATAAAGAATAPPAERVVLRDGTTFNHAVLVRLTPATFVVQTADALYELSEDEIDPATLRATHFTGAKPPLVTHHYDEIHADGTVTIHWSLPMHNDGRKAVTEMRMGLAPWERGHAAGRSYVDERGTPLISVYDPPLDRWEDRPDQQVRQIIPLAVPLAPGESTTITGRETVTWTRKTAEGLVYSSPGDYAEDRLVWRKVRLPRGATVIRATPEPSARFSHEGCEYLMWRRYYRANERFDLEVVYTLD